MARIQDREATIKTAIVEIKALTVSGKQVVSPFQAANTGDWLGEIGWQLQDEGDIWPELDEQDRPNISLAELEKRVKAMGYFRR